MCQTPGKMHSAFSMNKADSSLSSLGQTDKHRPPRVDNQSMIHDNQFNCNCITLERIPLDGGLHKIICFKIHIEKGKVAWSNHGKVDLEMYALEMASCRISLASRYIIANVFIIYYIT